MCEALELFFFSTCYNDFKRKLFISCLIGSKYSNELIYVLVNNIHHILKNFMTCLICFFRSQIMSLKQMFCARSLKVSHQFLYYIWSLIKFNTVKLTTFNAHRQTMKANAFNLEYFNVYFEASPFKWYTMFFSIF